MFIDYNNDWTDHHKQRDIVEIANSIIEKSIDKIHENKIDVYYSNNFSRYELSLLLRWPIYVAVNTFIDRLLTVFYNNKINYYNISDVNNSFKYFEGTYQSVNSYYNNYELNKSILCKIHNILSKNSNKFNSNFAKTSSNNQKKIIKKLSIKKIKKNFLKVIFYFTRNLKYYSFTFLLFSIQLFYFNNVIYEGDKWLKQIYPINSRFQGFKNKNYPLMNVTRRNIRKCLYDVFFQNIDKLNINFKDQSLKKDISSLFSKWIDQSLSFPVIEGLQERINFYSRILNKSRIREVHSCTGYFYNDNLKILSILAKRNKAILIAHEHGVDNFLNYFPSKENPNQYKGLNQLMVVDYYCAWGKGKIHDGFNEVEKKYKTKIINIGSVYLSRLNKWKKNSINKENFTVLYPSGPLRNFMASLEEISPQKNFLHKRKISYFLKNMLNKYPGMKILYKSFMGTGLEYDPLLDILFNQFSEGRIQICYDSPIDLIPKIDIVFFDMISTGFGEALNMEAPTLVYINKNNYVEASQYGKKINKMFQKAKTLFYEEQEGAKALDNILNNFKEYKKQLKEPRDIFIKELAFPVNKFQFKNNIIKMING